MAARPITHDLCQSGAVDEQGDHALRPAGSGVVGGHAQTRRNAKARSSASISARTSRGSDSPVEK
jgi:hypothetical protein